VDLGIVSIAILLGVLLAYILDRFGIPPLLGFFLSGLVVGRLFDFSMPEAYLQVLLALVAFEVGRQLGAAGLSPAAFFAVLIEAALILGFSMALFLLVRSSVAEALVASVMMLSSSSVLALRFSQTLPENARGIALSLATLEDVVLFFALSLLLGGSSFANLPVALAVLAALSLAALAIFSQVYKYIIGREYALPFAIAISIGFFYVVQYLQIASPFIGAFIGGYLFSKADVHKVHEKEATALSGLIIYFYALAVGLSVPSAEVRLDLLLLSFAVALFSVLVRATAAFLSSLLTTGQPKMSTDVALSVAHVSELSISTPVAASSLLKEASLVFALAISPVFTLFLAPVVWRHRGWFEKAVASRVREVQTVVAYEKLYRVVTHAFLTATKLAMLALATAFLLAYLWPISLAVAAVLAYYLFKYSSEIYRDLLIALRELGGARYASFAVLASTLALALYVALVLMAKVPELHLYSSIVITAMTIYFLYGVYRGLSTKRAEKRV